jgi:hypothetical protein
MIQRKRSSEQYLSYKYIKSYEDCILIDKNETEEYYSYTLNIKSIFQDEFTKHFSTVNGHYYANLLNIERSPNEININFIDRPNIKPIKLTIKYLKTDDYNTCFFESPSNYISIKEFCLNKENFNYFDLENDNYDGNILYLSKKSYESLTEINKQYTLINFQDLSKFNQYIDNYIDSILGIFPNIQEHKISKFIKYYEDNKLFKAASSWEFCDKNNFIYEIIKYYVKDSTINTCISEEFIEKSKNRTLFYKKEYNESKFEGIAFSEDEIGNAITQLRYCRQDIHDLFNDYIIVYRLDTGNLWNCDPKNFLLSKIFGLPEVDQIVTFSCFISTMPSQTNLKQINQYYSICNFMFKIKLSKKLKNWVLLGPFHIWSEILISSKALFKVISVEKSKILVPNNETNYTITNIPVIELELLDVLCDNYLIKSSSE